tara:strand:+ start:950 stop:1186 length:237 start_codon:yes stop_codon:yes gene_type:complete
MSHDQTRHFPQVEWQCFQNSRLKNKNLSDRVLLVETKKRQFILSTSEGIWYILYLSMRKKNIAPETRTAPGLPRRKDF